MSLVHAFILSWQTAGTDNLQAGAKNDDPKCIPNLVNIGYMGRKIKWDVQKDRQAGRQADRQTEGQGILISWTCFVPSRNKNTCISLHRIHFKSRSLETSELKINPILCEQTSSQNRTCRPRRWVKFTFSTSGLDRVVGQYNAPAILPPGKEPGAHEAGSWSDPRANLGRCGISRSPRHSIPGPSSM
jgi:hypothetical protein